MIVISGAAMVAGVVGDPVAHSLSPRIHGAWIEALGLDAAYVPLAVPAERFIPFIEGLRGGIVRGLNITIPHKQAALAMADEADAIAQGSGAANLLVFHSDGRIEARNTDGAGMLAALAEQAPQLDLAAAPVVILGAGGAARGAVAALAAAGVPQIRLINRTMARAAELASAFPRTAAFAFEDAAIAFQGAGAVINATSAGLDGAGGLDLPLDALPATAVVMDMVYKPLRTALLEAAAARGLATVDGLAMLVGQARPSFEAFFGRPSPASVDVRGICLAALGDPR
jgi:shikimate dehydrogenase